MTMRVGVGVLHYRFWPGVRVSLDALIAQTRTPDVAIVLDNGSDDGSHERIAEAYPHIELVRITHNRGPIAGMNALMRTLLDREVDAVLQVTHDCRLAPDALEHLVRRLEEDDAVGAVGPLIGDVDNPEEVALAGSLIDRRTWDLRLIKTPTAMEEWKGRPPHPVDWLNGSAILHRATAARDAGPLHEDYFVYFDEVDYFVKMAQRGWRVECVPSAHAWERNSGAGAYFLTRNRLGFIRRHAPRRILARELTRIGMHTVRDTVRPRYPEARGERADRLRGVRDFARGRWGPGPGR